MQVSDLQALSPSDGPRSSGDALVLPGPVRSASGPKSSTRRQGVFWLLTAPLSVMPAEPELVPGISWLKGQREIGAGGLDHWQFVAAFSRKKSLVAVLQLFPRCHAELTRSDAACDYVWKDDTAVAGTRFEHGVKPINRSIAIEWEVSNNYNTSPYGSPPKEEISNRSHPVFVFKVIGPSALLERIMPSLFLLSAEPSSTRGLLEVVSPIKHGRSSQMLLLKTHGPSGGRGIKVISI